MTSKPQRSGGMQVRFVTSYLERLMGLLFTAPDDLEADALLLVPCSAVHTLLMQYPIDLAFIASDGTVLLAAQGVLPWRVRIGCSRAVAVMERPSSRGGRWPETGERVVLSSAPERGLGYPLARRG